MADLQLVVGHYYKARNGRRFKVVDTEVSTLGLTYWIVYDGADHSERRSNGRVGFFKRDGDDLVMEIKPCHLVDNWKSQLTQAVFDAVDAALNKDPTAERNKEDA